MLTSASSNRSIFQTVWSSFQRTPESHQHGVDSGDDEKVDVRIDSSPLPISSRGRIAVSSTSIAATPAAVDHSSILIEGPEEIVDLEKIKTQIKAAHVSQTSIDVDGRKVKIDRDKTGKVKSFQYDIVKNSIRVTAHRHMDGYLLKYKLHANGAQIRDLVRNNSFNTNTMISKMISALGQSHIIRMLALTGGCIAQTDSFSEAVINLGQKRLEALLGLERQLNGYNNHITDNPVGTCLQKNKEKLIAAFEKYKEDVNKILQNLKKDFPEAKYPQLHYEMTNNLLNDIQAAENLMVELNTLPRSTCCGVFTKDIKEFMSADPRSGLRKFMNGRLNVALSQLQSINQNQIYGTMGLLRGDVHSVIQDARAIKDKYVYDAKSIIHPHHQGIFDAHKTWQVDSKERFSNPDNALMAMGFITGNDKVTPGEEGKFDLNGHELRVVRDINWQGSYSQTWKYFANTGLGLTVGLFYDLFHVGGKLIKGNTSSTPAWSDSHSLEINKPHYSDSTGRGLQKKLTFTQFPILNLVVHKFGEFLYEIGIESSIGFKELFVEMFEEFLLDWADGHDSAELNDSNIKNVIIEFCNYLSRKTVDSATQKSGDDDVDGDNQNVYQQLSAGAHELDLSEVPDACDPYQYPSDVHHEVFVRFVQGLGSFADLYVDNIARKHTLVWLGAAGIGLAGAAPYLTDYAREHFKSWFLNLCDYIADAASNGAFMDALSVGSTLAQCELAIMDGILHGSNSFVATGLKLFAEQPANFLFYIGFAYAAGVLVQASGMPFFASEEADSEGKYKGVVQFITGTKITILLYDFFEKHKHLSHDQMKEPLAKFIENFVKTKVPLELQVQCQNYLDAQITPAALDKLVVDSVAWVEKLDPVKKDQILGQMFLMKLMNHHEEFSKLEIGLKYKLEKLAKTFFKKEYGNAQIVDTVHELLYPTQSSSIAKTTVKVYGSYLPLLLRICGTPITWTTRPLRELPTKLLTDIKRVGTLTSSACGSLLFRFLALSIAKPGSDLVVNEIFARIEGLIFGLEGHLISNFSRDATIAFDNGVDAFAAWMNGLGADTIEALNNLFHYLSRAKNYRELGTTPPEHAGSLLLRLLEASAADQLSTVIVVPSHSANSSKDVASGVVSPRSGFVDVSLLDASDLV